MQSTMIGVYGSWAASLVPDTPGSLSLRNDSWNDIAVWRQTARDGVWARLASPDLGGTPPVTIHSQTTYDGLHIEELSWQLPYGEPTQAVFLKPVGVQGRLPGLVGLHCHGGQKFFGKEKITRTGEGIHPVMASHQDRYYGGRAWANELAKRGFAVLVHDAFAFGSRRVRLADVPQTIRNGVVDPKPEDLAGIEAYNRWAANHESILAKSLFCAGTTWPGVFLAEDRVALDVLCARDDVDPQRVGCGGLSGGGLRTVFLGGMDERIRCAVSVGMMTTWRDYLLNKSHTHTWMVYVPLLPAELDYPEILGLRAPLPTLVQNDTEDQLFTLPEMQRADGILQEVFAKAGYPDHYRGSYYPGPHKFDQEMQAEAFNWFERWLK
jgi:dienelactone hydrolase